jgi:predicted transcriptional regulator
MIKARAGNIVILGLEPRNLTRLQERKPMLIRLRELGIDTDIVIAIMYGDDHQDITAQIERDTGLKMPDIDPVNDKPI